MRKLAPTLTMTPAQHAIYEPLLHAARTIGPFTADPKKTSIHLTRRSAFAGIATRNDALQLRISRPPTSAARASSSASRRRRIAGTWRSAEEPDQVDRELTSWLADAMRLAN